MSKPKDYIGKAPIYQRWDEKAFAFDTGHMHWTAQLLYRTLLQKAFHLSSRPDLPADDSQLQNILGVPAAVWDEHKAAVRAMFNLDTAVGDGVLWQKRLRNDWQDLFLYRLQQKKRIDAHWAAVKALKTQQVDPTVLPANNDGNSSKAEHIEKSKNINIYDSGPAPSAIAMGAPKQAGETLTSPAAPADRKTSDVQALVSFVYEKSSCVPPDTAEVVKLLRQFSLPEIKWAFAEFISDKASAKMVGAVRVFFRGENAAAIIEKRRRADWLESVEGYTTRLDEEKADTFAEFIEQPIPSGIPDAETLLARATKSIEKWKSENEVAS
jgi:hypothetical protein